MKGGDKQYEHDK